MAPMELTGCPLELTVSVPALCERNNLWTLLQCVSAPIVLPSPIHGPMELTLTYPMELDG